MLVSAVASPRAPKYMRSSSRRLRTSGASIESDSTPPAKAAVIGSNNWAVSGQYTATGKVLLGVRRQGDRLVVLVCDTGPGIPGSKHALIFQEFQRLPQTAGTVRGLGLGLSIVERIGKVLDHRVELRSVLYHGSTFSVELPRAGARAVEPMAAMAPSVGRIAGLTVLCIDNEPAGLAGMQVLLVGIGPQPAVARRPDEQRHSDQAEKQQRSKDDELAPEARRQPGGRLDLVREHDPRPLGG